MFKPIAMLLALVVTMCACDRRDDPDVDPALTGASTPPGQPVDTTPDSTATTPTTPAPVGTETPVAPNAPPVDCEGLQGSELTACVEREKQAGDRREPVQP